jgi:diguanylate cyclase (GGDEF)-like protein/PAS domain S-box-containing protein
MKNLDLKSRAVLTDFFQYFVEKISDGVIVIDEHGTVVFANSIAADLLDTGSENLIGSFLLKPQTISQDLEIAPLRTDRSKKVLNLIHLPCDLDDQGLYMLLLRDVVINSALDKSRNDSCERYRTIVENASEGIFTTTWTGRFITANPAFVRLLGYDFFGQMDNEIKDLTSLFCPQPESQETYRGLLLQQGYVSNFEVSCFRRDGSQICGLFNSHLVRDDKGNIQFVEGLFQDITSRKRVEEELRASEARYRILYEEAKRGEEIYQSLLKSSPDAVVVYDMQGMANFVSPSFSKMFGWSLEEVQGRKIPFVPDEELAPTLERINPLVQYGVPCVAFETRRYTKDGRLLNISVSASRYNDHDGVPAGMLVMLRDITERKTAEKQLARSKETIEALFNASPDSVFLLDRNGVFLTANKQTAQGLEKNLEDIVGQSARQFLPMKSAMKEEQNLSEVIETGTGVRYEEFRAGRVFFKSMYPVFGIGGKVEGAAVFVRDITERKKAEQERERLIAELTAARDHLRYQATHDFLSGLWNRSAVFSALEKELIRASRQNSFVGVLMIDIDFFKEVNDRYGHLAGDIVIKEVANKIETLTRPYDTVGRYGGEEFIVVAPGCDLAGALHLAERLRESFCSEGVQVGTSRIPLTLSLGVLSIPGGDSWDVDTIVGSVDQALYKAKKSGRNRVEVSGMDS